MAGEDDLILDMSMFDIEPDNTITEPPDIKTEVVESKKEEDKGIESKTDDAGQENVGKEKSTEIKDEKNPNSPADSNDGILFQALAESLKNQGFFSSLDNIEIKNEEDLAKAFKEELKRNEFSDLSETQKEYLEALREGVPDEVVKDHFHTGTVFANITDNILENDEAIRKQVIIQERIAKGWTPERAEREYKRINDLGEGLEESKFSLDSLKQMEQLDYKQKVEEAKQVKIEEEKQNKERLDNLKKAVYKEEKFLNTFKVDDGLKGAVHRSMTDIIGYDELGRPLNKLMQHRMQDPLDFEVKLYYMYELTKGFTDISKFTNKAMSTASKKLTNAISNSTYIKSSGGKTPYDVTDDRDDVPQIVDVIT